MIQKFLRIAGVGQTGIGLLSQFVPSIGSILGTQAASGNIFNIVSGAALGFLGLKGSASGQRAGALGIGGLNGLVGILGALGMNNILGLQLNEGIGSVIVQLAVGAWGLIAGLGKKKAA